MSFFYFRSFVLNLSRWEMGHLGVFESHLSSSLFAPAALAEVYLLRLFRADSPKQTQQVFYKADSKKEGTHEGYPCNTGIETSISMFVLRHSRLTAPFKLLQPHTYLHQKYTKARDRVLSCSLPGKTCQHTILFHLAPQLLVTCCNQLLVEIHIRIHQLSPISY